MSLPGDALAPAAVPGVLLAPDVLGRPSRIIDYERGGIALNDGTQGLNIQNWRARLVGTEIRVAPEPYNVETVVLTLAGITELSLSFDQNMQPVIAYVQDGQTKLYWYSTALEAFTTTTLDVDVRSPFLSMDDKRRPASTINSNDVLLFYLRGGYLCYRQQRDSYSIERQLALVADSTATIKEVGMNSNLRMQVIVTGHATAMHTSLEADTLYVAAGGDIVPLFEGALLAGVWRSKVIVLDEQLSMAWARIEADAAVVLRLFGDGHLFYTSPPIVSPEPFRLPAVRFRELEAEINSSAKAVALYVAGSFAELALE